MRLVDFQLSIAGTGLQTEQQRALNEAMFPAYEAVRLWVKDRAIAAPFKKVVVQLSDSTVAARWHGSTSLALGICEVTEAVAIDELVEHRGDYVWAGSRILDGLSHIRTRTGWGCSELVAMVEEMSARTPPCLHRFARLDQRDERTGLACEVLLEAGLGTTAVKVRFRRVDGSTHDVVVAARSGPLFLEDDFPVSATRLRLGHLELLAQRGHVLASVPLPTE